MKNKEIIMSLKENSFSNIESEEVVRDKAQFVNNREIVKDEIDDNTNLLKDTNTVEQVANDEENKVYLQVKTTIETISEEDYLEQDVLWSKLNTCLNKISNADLLIKIYGDLQNIKNPYDVRLRFSEDFRLFLENFLSKLINTQNGFNFVKEILYDRCTNYNMESEWVPKKYLALLDLGDYIDEGKQDGYDFFQSILINKMFEANSKEAAVFFGEYLGYLDKMTERGLFGDDYIGDDMDDDMDYDTFYYDEYDSNPEEVTPLTVDNLLKLMEDDIEICKKDLSRQDSNIIEDSVYLEILRDKFDRLADYQENYDILKKTKDLSQIQDFLIRRRFIDKAPYEREMDYEEFMDADLFDVFPITAKSILNNLEKYGSESNIKDIVAYLKNDCYSYAHRREVSDCLNAINPNVSAEELLSALDDEDDFVRKIITNVIHRIEFGRIGISAEGVKYLEKMYDLGEYNNSDYHVSRLTDNGEIGVFNKEKELIKYFELENLSSNKKEIKANVLDFTYNTLFFGRANENEDEKQKRLKYLDEFKNNYYKIANDKIFEQTGVRLNNLSFKEQGWFVIYFNEADEDSKEELKKFVLKFGENGIKTFLAMESDECNGDKILNIGKNLDVNIAEKVFNKFNEISSLINQGNQELSSKFFKNSKNNIEPIEEILKQAGKVLIDYENKINVVNYVNLSRDKREKINTQIIQDLLRIKKDIVFFTSMFKTAFEQDEDLDFEEIKGLDFKTVTADNITLEEQKEILELATSIYSDNKVVLEEVLSDIKRAFAKGDRSKWYILKKEGKLLSSIRFDKDGLDKNNLYVGSFMVNKEMSGSAIGSVMERESMDFEAKHNKIHGIVEMRRSVASHYIEKKGYIIDGIEKDDKSGVHLFKITRDDKVNTKYITRESAPTYTLDSIKNEIQVLDSQDLYDKNDIKTLKTKNRFAIRVIRNANMPQLNDSDIDKFNNIFSNENGQSFVLTRMIYNEEEGESVAYCVFEKKIIDNAQVHKVATAV